MSVSASKCVRCRVRTGPAGRFAMASSTSPQRHPWSGLVALDHDQTVEFRLERCQVRASGT